MVIPGNPNNIPTLARVAINPYVNGQKHHSSGYYIITGINDDISNGAFTTTYKLLKLPS
jgi:hypothetical protein